MNAQFGMRHASSEDWRQAPETLTVSINARIANEDSAVADRRRADRADVEVEARVRELGNEGCDARVLNISATGFMAQTSTEIAVGARIWLIIPGHERANALVRWSDGDRIGAEFATPIDPADLLSN
ncbi:PilZ domain-containing protein [Sphingomonas ginsengisoli (ex An et al. 2013)]|nr:PilZ domain-containing protein [Sphingomonas ginsengisoli An et al. 2013]